ncbi:MAG: hypothetical protein WD181_05140 [Solirubrobacterales bacterium]
MSRELGGHEDLVAYVTPDERWRFPADLTAESIESAEPLGLPDALARLAGLEVNLALPQMFCLPGMTSYRALLELIGIEYIGNRPEVMALAADKVKAKAVVAAAGVRVPDGELLRPGQSPSIIPPAVVKPADADNSLGVTLVRESGRYAAALEQSFEHSSRALVESYVELGREVRCGIVVRDGELLCLPLEEYRVTGIRNHRDKIIRNSAGALELVAKENPSVWIVDPDDPVTAIVHEAARRSHVALGCRDYSLFDFRIDPDGKAWFIEASLYCSFARQSVISVMAAAAGFRTSALLGLFLAPV